MGKSLGGSGVWEAVRPRQQKPAQLANHQIQACSHGGTLTFQRPFKNKMTPELSGGMKYVFLARLSCRLSYTPLSCGDTITEQTEDFEIIFDSQANYTTFILQSKPRSIQGQLRPTVPSDAKLPCYKNTSKIKVWSSSALKINILNNIPVRTFHDSCSPCLE